MNLKRIGDIATFINGYPFKPEQWEESGLPIIRIQNLTKSSLEVNYYNGEISDRYIVNEGDVLIAWSASLGVHEWSGETAVLNQHIFKVTFDKVDIDKSYFKYMVSIALRNAVKYLQGSTMKHITKKYFDNIKIPFPSIEKQRRISKVLDIGYELIQNRQSQITALDELAKSVFLDMFGDPVLNEMKWSQKKLSDLGTLKRGMSKHRPRNAPELLGGPYPLIQTGDVAKSGVFIKEYHNTYSEIGLRQSRLWDSGTLCITIAANIARTGILDFDACFPDSVVGYAVGKQTNNIFVHYWFGFFQEILERNAPESAQKNINLKILNNIDIINPPIELQDKFQEIIIQIENQKNGFIASLELLQDLHNALLQKAFNGELFQDQS